VRDVDRGSQGRSRDRERRLRPRHAVRSGVVKGMARNRIWNKPRSRRRETEAGSTWSGRLDRAAISSTRIGVAPDRRSVLWLMRDDPPQKQKNPSHAVDTVCTSCRIRYAPPADEITDPGRESHRLRLASVYRTKAVKGRTLTAALRSERRIRPKASTSYIFLPSPPSSI